MARIGGDRTWESAFTAAVSMGMAFGDRRRGRDGGALHQEAAARSRFRENLQPDYTYG
jgi:hypothetical protein